MFRHPRIALAALAAGVLASSQAAADDVHCPPGLGAVSIDGNVLVTGPCTLDGTRVDGNVHIYSGGSLRARDAVIGGNVQAERAFEVDIADSHVGGSVQLDELVGDFSVVATTVVTGNIQLKSNRSQLQIDGNRVGADIQAFSNSGGVDIFGNVVDGNLQCKSNDPAATGSNNTVRGNKEDQCANLQPAVSGSTLRTATSAAFSSPTAVATSGSVAAQDGSGGGGASDLLGLLLMTALLAWRRFGSGAR